MNVSETIVRCLEAEEVEYIFGVPGEENIDLLDALYDSDIEFIVTRHETSAAFMAGIYGRLAGKPGVCLATLGPGATNLLTGVANSNMDLNPVVAITGQAGLNRQHKISHQYYDLIKIYEPVTKWNAQIKTPDIVPEVVRKAFQVASSEKPGATHFDLPEDIASAEYKAEPLTVRMPKLSGASEETIQEAAELIQSAENPLIIAGNGITRGKASNVLRSFIEHTSIPVVHTFMGKGALPWTHDLSLLTAGLGSQDYITCGLNASDLIITIGFDIAEYSPKDWNPEGDKPILHIDTTNPETDAFYPVKTSVIGDIGQNLSKLKQALPQLERDVTWAKEVRDNAMNELKDYEQDSGFPVKPQRIISDLREALNDDDIVISDVGAHKMWMARLFHTAEPNTCLISNGLASMGVAVPGAISAKMVQPEKNVVAVCGDGAFLMTGAELETAVRLNLPIVVLLWRDDGYGLIEWHQMKKFNRASYIEFGNPNYVDLAKSYGFESFEIQQAEELLPTLKQAISLNKPVLIDCPVDYRENMKLTEKLGDIICK
ncbi:acetolactate synthase large subunit [Alkalibacillus almallahensis]|uniref:acetolactate synthase large subunit n=1 Tax=Alkalibacillus almallahensis TaxID=1379154 RepID=UPI001ABBC54C|nr:acetolactate synthase large subunit [Alkalibacillus almallahensis]NIK12997.1 acetolactate synthase-1/2/3 large subunit [Alkalibacillus almallahensis]